MQHGFEIRSSHSCFAGQFKNQAYRDANGWSLLLCTSQPCNSMTALLTGMPPHAPMCPMSLSIDVSLFQVPTLAREIGPMGQVDQSSSSCRGLLYRGTFVFGESLCLRNFCIFSPTFRRLPHDYNMVGKMLYMRVLPRGVSRPVVHVKYLSLLDQENGVRRTTYRPATLRSCPRG